ncbi:hypothetical protein GCM10027019_14150 [Melaminivora jejuensis]
MRKHPTADQPQPAPVPFTDEPGVAQQPCPASVPSQPEDIKPSFPQTFPKTPGSASAGQQAASTFTQRSQ